MLRLRANGREIVVRHGDVVTIGRDETSVLRIIDPRISRHHAVVRAGAAGWLIEDLGSTNGTFLNGERVGLLTITRPLELRLGHDQEGVLVELIPDAPAPTPPSRATPASPPLPTPTDSPTLAPPASPVLERTATLYPTPSSPPAPPEDLSAVAAQSLGNISAIYEPPRRSVIKIGRAADNDIVPTDLLVSRHHAELRISADGRFELVDLESYNGTFVNGRRIKQQILNDHDYITVGRSLFRYVNGTLEEYVDSGRVPFEVVDVTVKTADGHVLLSDVSFPLEPCSLLGIVGPSGAGKSTLISTLMGLRTPTEGRVYYAGRDFYAAYDDLRQRIGYVPQDDIVHPQLTVRQALEFAAELRFPPDISRDDRSQRVGEVIEELGLTERSHLAIRNLSGGQRKRSSIAQELLTKPSLLFLDEPTSGLDPGYEKTIMTLLRELADSGRTVIVVTHSVQSLDLCDRVLFLAPGGKVAYFGPPADALSFFERDDFADVFRDLDQDRDTNWQKQYRAHHTYEDFVQGPLKQSETRRVALSPAQVIWRPHQRWVTQVNTLVRRYFAVLLSDRRNLLLLLLQAPILGLLILGIVKPGSFDLSVGETQPDAGTAALLMVLSATLMGATISIREIVKELPIYRRERLIGLSVSAYLTSKLLVLGGLVLLQSLVLTGIAVQRLGGPRDALVLGWPFGELVAAVALAGLAAMTLALLISALVRASDKAVALLPLLLLPQIVFSGPVIRLEDKPVMEALSYVWSARWGFSAVANTIDLNSLRRPPPQPSDSNTGTGTGTGTATSPQADPNVQNLLPFVDQDWEHARDRWLRNISVLVALSTLAILATWLALRRKDISH